LAQELQLRRRLQSVSREGDVQKASISHHKTWWGVTFGVQTELRNCWVRIYADSEDEARRIMIERYGRGWAFMYCAPEMVRIAAKYGLNEVAFGTPVVSRDDAGDQGADDDERDEQDG
jgi:hypothetical protein